MDLRFIKLPLCLRVFSAFRAQWRVLYILTPILSTFSMIAFAAERPSNETLWVATAFSAGGQFLGIPITEQKTTAAELKIYFSKDQTAYITIVGDKGQSQGLVLGPNNTVASQRDQSGANFTVEVNGSLDRMYIKYTISSVPLSAVANNPNGNLNFDVVTDWTIDIRNGNCTILDKHHYVNTTNPLVNAMFTETVGGASCRLYPGKPFL
jgi:hypothetical protein